MRKFLALVCAFALGGLAFSASPASAQQVSWRVIAREGVVRVRQPGQDLADAMVNQTLRAGTAVTTGADSRATLQNGAQRIVMTPNSRMTIAPDSNDGMTRILQDLGSLLFQVDRRDAQHFRVETPLLAAVVKGTTFTVSTGVEQDLVHVSQGLVEVRANDGGAVNDVAAGITARIARGAPSAIAMTAPSDTESVAQGLATPALDYSAASAGLVDGPETNGRATAAARNALGASPNGNGHGANSESNSNGGGSSLFGRSVAAVRNLIASLAGGNGNGNGNAGGNGNGNAGGNGNGNAGGNGNGNGNGNAGNGNSGNSDPGDPPVLPACRGRACG
ncbi:MAG: FecR family protein [Terricaulis sp.]